MTKIEWTDETWSPVVGCTKVSAGCQNCYAERMMYRQVCMGAARHEKNPDSNEDAWIAYSGVMDEDTHKWNGEVSLRYDQLDQPLHWRKPRRIFVCSMSDLFHEAVSFEFIDKVAMTIALAPQHTYQILTKRPERALACHHRWLNKSDTNNLFQKNVWLGVSVENQKAADERIPILLQIPAAVRFVSFEPLLKPLDVSQYLQMVHRLDKRDKVDWAIIGAESGPKRRECKLEWVRDLVEQCKAANVKIFVKQLSINGKVEHDIKKFPEWARIRQMPKGE